MFRPPHVGTLLLGATLGLHAVSGSVAGEDKNASDGAPARPNILFCLADDWSWPHASAYGTPVVKTPTFDRLASKGVLFTNAFATAPSCTPSRAGILTGQAVHRLHEGANQSGILPGRFPVYPDLLEESGYFVGYCRKGWAPGTLKGTGRKRNPCGPKFRDFATFLEKAPADKPFCFWFGSIDPHRPYEKGSGEASGMKPDAVRVSPHLPDTPVVRSDLLDYFFEIQRFDREVGQLLQQARRAGRLGNTLVVISGDQGMPFPRCKTTVYDSGLRVPLVFYWPEQIPGGRQIDDFVSHADLAPTFLVAARLTPPEQMTGRSLLELLLCNKSGRVDPARDKVFLERERHACTREGNQSYPSRAVRTSDYIYIRNLRPNLLPAGDPRFQTISGPYSDIDRSPTKDELLARRDDPAIAPFFQRACQGHPAEELYVLDDDPGQIHNVAEEPKFANVKFILRAELEHWMRSTGDLRAEGETDLWDKSPYVGSKMHRVDLDDTSSHK